MQVTYAAAFGAALLAALIATPAVRFLALKLGVLDHPAPRKLHTDPVPYLGGVAIIAAFMVAVAGGLAVRSLEVPYSAVTAILGGGALMAAVGLWDDLKVVPGWVKVPAEILVALALYTVGIRAQLFGVPLLDLVVTVGWVVGITNAVNYMDNMDGLTAGVAAIASAYFFALGVLSSQFAVAALAAALAGCALGFWWHNRPPARIFMGDSGSLFFGFMLAALGLVLRFDNILRVTFFVPVAVMSVPILDTLLVTISRLRRGVSPIHPGRDHISHRLVGLGVPTKAALALHYFAAAACGWIGVVISRAEPHIAYMLMGWLLALGLFFGGLLLRVKVDG